MANGLQRTPEQKNYRDNLANGVKNLRQYGDTGRELAKNLLEKEQQKDFYKNSTTKFLKDNQKSNERIKNELIDELTECIDKKDFKAVAWTLSFFDKGQVDSAIAEKLIEEGQAKIVVDNLKKRSLYDIEQPCKFKKLSANTAEKLIEQGYQEDILYSLDDFEVDDHILELLMQYYGLKENNILREQYRYIIRSFKGLNKKVFDIFARKHIITVAGLKAFEGLDKDSLLILLEYCYITVKDEEILNDWIKDKKFGLLDNEVALKLPTWIVGENFELFEGLLHLQIAKDLIEAGYGSVVAKHPEKFGLKKEK